MKTKAIIMALAVAATLFTGCSAKEAATETKPAATTEAKTETATETKTETATETKTEDKADVVSTASITDNIDVLIKAMSKDGTWLMGTNADVTTDKELLLDGQFLVKEAPARKLALYNQDENRVITARYTLTAPKLTITSENAKIMGGVFVGDVYVEAKGFTVEDAVIKGNVYFASEDLKATMKLVKDGKIEGNVEVKK